MLTPALSIEHPAARLESLKLIGAMLEARDIKVEKTLLQELLLPVQLDEFIYHAQTAIEKQQSGASSNPSLISHWEIINSALHILAYLPNADASIIDNFITHSFHYALDYLHCSHGPARKECALIIHNLTSFCSPHHLSELPLR